MKAWLAAFIVLTTTHVAAAKRVIMTPTIPRSCPGADSWEKVSTCVSRFGKMRIERELPDAKLISLGSDHYRAPGLYIYALKGKRWQLAGMLETEVTFELESFKRVKIMGHTGFRFDIAFAEPVTVDPDRTGDRASRDFVQQKESVFCAGGSYSCTDIRTSCESVRQRNLARVVPRQARAPWRHREGRRRPRAQRPVRVLRGSRRDRSRILVPEFRRSARAAAQGHRDRLIRQLVRHVVLVDGQRLLVDLVRRRGSGSARSSR